jgi:hypothetical protein
MPPAATTPPPPSQVNNRWLLGFRRKVQMELIAFHLQRTSRHHNRDLGKIAYLADSTKAYV